MENFIFCTVFLAKKWNSFSHGAHFLEIFYSKKCHISFKIKNPKESCIYSPCLKNYQMIKLSINVFKTHAPILNWMEYQLPGGLFKVDQNYFQTFLSLHQCHFHYQKFENLKFCLRQLLILFI